jgi:hypothetical protein
MEPTTNVDGDSYDSILRPASMRPSTNVDGDVKRARWA